MESFGSWHGARALCLGREKLDYGNPATSAVGEVGLSNKGVNQYEINILSQLSLAH